MNASELYQAGQLGEAIQAALNDVKAHPTDFSRRYLLSELLCFAGDFERADKQLDVVFQQATDQVMRISLVRHLIAAETSRQKFFTEGRLPDFIGEPTESLQKRLEASVELRVGNHVAAMQFLAAAEEMRPTVSGECNGQAFESLRDLDDLLSGVFEVLTSTGKYFWIPMEQVELVEFQPPQRPLDLLWREAHMIVTDGPDGVVYVPSIYAPHRETDDDQLRLGRGTDWLGDDGQVVQGRGLRMFLIGDDDRTIMDLKTLKLQAAK
ncbi:MAG: hypothetical protein KDA92_02725 [Planctomycetales bacterium]|nr:hypothetical protein [Planctomycetales bacterium]